MKAEDITGEIHNSCEHVATFYCINQLWHGNGKVNA